MDKRHQVKTFFFYGFLLCLVFFYFGFLLCLSVRREGGGKGVKPHPYPPLPYCPSSANSLEHMLEGGTSTPPYHPLHYSSRLFRSSPSSVKVYLACISESIHFLTMNHRRKKSSLDAFYPYSTLKAPKPKKKSKKFILIFFCLCTHFFKTCFGGSGVCLSMIGTDPA